MSSSCSPANIIIPYVASPPAPEFAFSRAKTLTSSSPSPHSFTGHDSTPPFPAGGEAGMSGELIGMIVGAALATTIILIGVCVFLCFYKRKKKKKKKKAKQRDSEANINGVPKLDNSNLHHWKQSTNSDIANNLFTYEDLAKATENFSNTNLIGQGGFGYVHRGVLSDGTKVAIKQLKAGSGQGEREFQAEIQIISRVHHRHLVSLLGYCIIGSQRLLVYDFVPNKTLEFHLHGEI